LDLDGDGHISINELRTHFKNMGVRVTARTLNDLMAEVDVNRNGQVEFDEFVAVRAHLSFNFFWSFLLLFFFFSSSSLSSSSLGLSLQMPRGSLPLRALKDLLEGEEGNWKQSD